MNAVRFNATMPVARCAIYQSCDVNIDVEQTLQRKARCFTIQGSERFHMDFPSKHASIRIKYHHDAAVLQYPWLLFHFEE